MKPIVTWGLFLVNGGCPLFFLGNYVFFYFQIVLLSSELLAVVLVCVTIYLDQVVAILNYIITKYVQINAVYNVRLLN